MKTQKLLTIGDAKTSKGEILGFITAILYMSPYTQNSFGKNLCAFATKGCIKACLFTAGMGIFSNVQKARIAKSDFFLSDKIGFLTSLFNQIARLEKKHGKALAIRLNGTTDIPFEGLKLNGLNLFEHFPNVQFYDYTKNAKRMNSNRHINYHLTFSRAETVSNKAESIEVLKASENVAIVFEKKLHEVLTNSKGQKLNVGGTYYDVVNGDETDLRFLDGKNKVVALKAKGKAIKENSGFVVNSINELL